VVTRRTKRQEGLALLTTAVVLVLVALLAVAALDDASRESTAGGRSRAATRSVHAADAGLQLARTHLTETPPNLTAINVSYGGATIQSRSRSQSTPQTLEQVGIGEAPEGYSVNIGPGASFFNRLYQINVTATAGESAAELEAKLSRVEAEGQGY
jgi:Tfp pilus assembly protein PilX